MPRSPHASGRDARRLLPALFAALAAAGAACESAPAEPCPGTVIGRFQLGGWIQTAACGAGPSAGLEASLPATFSVTATLASDGAEATLCHDDGRAYRPTGTRAGDAFDLAAAVEGTSFAPCGGSCSARAEERLRFDLVRDGGGAVTGLTGTVEDGWSGGAGCDACTLPCTAQYTLTGTLLP